LVLKFKQLLLVTQQNRHDHWLKDYWVTSVSSSHCVGAANIHKLIKSLLFLITLQRLPKALSVVNLKFQCHTIRRNGFAHELCPSVSNVGDVGLDEVLFCEGFVE
jgi:hypothetical protein